LKQLKPFLIKIRSTLPLTEVPFASLKVWRKGCRPMKSIEGKCFQQNHNTFYTSNFLYSPFVPAYYFYLAHTLLFFAHVFTHNLRHHLFWKDNNWHHYFMKGKERRVLFLKENKWHRFLMEGKLNMYMWHIYLH